MTMYENVLTAIFYLTALTALTFCGIAAYAMICG